MVPKNTNGNKCFQNNVPSAYQTNTFYATYLSIAWHIEANDTLKPNQALSTINWVQLHECVVSIEFVKGIVFRDTLA